MRPRSGGHVVRIRGRQLTTPQLKKLEGAYDVKRIYVLILQIFMYISLIFKMFEMFDQKTSVHGFCKLFRV
jgi:hypothetical protein